MIRKILIMIKDMVRYNLLIALMLAAGIEVSAQTTNHQWSLKECINYALDHNISVKQQENNRRQKEIELSTSRNSRLPNLSVSGSQNFSFGRGLTSQNTYENKNTSSTSLSLGTTVPLFTGYQIPNTIKLNQLNLQPPTPHLKKPNNNIHTHITQPYLQILYNIQISQLPKQQIT